MITNNKFRLSCCQYCHRRGHVRKNCKLVSLHILYRLSNIPKKYWFEDDPVKQYLLNENIKSYSSKNYKQIYKIY